MFCFVKKHILFGIGLGLAVFGIVACEDSSDEGGPPDAGDLLLGGGAMPDGSSTTTDTGAADSSNDVLADVGVGDGGGVPPLLPPDWFVSPTGDDANDGKSTAKPFKTLCKVRDVVQANQVIVLMDGAYESGNQRPVGWIYNAPCSPTFTTPVVLHALNAGQALVRVPLAFNQGGAVRGIKLENAPPGSGSFSSGVIQATGGTLTIRALTVGDVTSSPNAKAAPLVVSGSAKVTLIPDGVANYTTVPVANLRGQMFAFITGGGELTVEGGTFDDSAANNADSYCNPLFEGGGKLTLNGVTVHHKGTVLRAYGTASIEGSVIENRSIALNSGCGPVIGVLGNIDIRITNTSIRGRFRGLDTETVSWGPVTITNSTLEGSVDYGINLSGNMLKLRGSTVKSAGIGIRIAGVATADLGTAADVGGNTLTGSTTTALRVETATVVSAVGNTWVANQQGSDAQGKYPAAELKTGPITGLNFTLVNAAHSTQL